MQKQQTIRVGDAVRILTGLWGGRTGTVTAVRFGGVHTVEFSAPRYLLDPSGPEEVKRLPYAADELVPAASARSRTA